MYLMKIWCYGEKSTAFTRVDDRHGASKDWGYLGEKYAGKEARIYWPTTSSTNYEESQVLRWQKEPEAEKKLLTEGMFTQFPG